MNNARTFSLELSTTGRMNIRQGLADPKAVYPYFDVVLRSIQRGGTIYASAVGNKEEFKLSWTGTYNPYSYSNPQSS